MVRAHGADLLGRERLRDLGFLQGGGDMGARMRAHDWSTSPLGPPEAWPESLRAVVALMINSRYPMFIAWGPELAFLYNDGYIPIFGAKHPHTLGLPFKTVWPEIWDDIWPLIDKALKGEATFNEDLHLVMERNGYPEDTWYSFSYSPVRDESGAVAGMFCACTETTEKVLAERALKAERDRLAEMFEQAPGFIAMLEGPEHRFTLANAAYRTLIGGRETEGRTVGEVLPEAASQGFLSILDDVFQRGEPYRALATPVDLRTADGGSDRRVLDFIYQPLRGANGQVAGIFVEGQDVTDKVRAEAAMAEGEARYRAVFEKAGVGVARVSPDGRFLEINDRYCEILQRGRDQLLGATFASVTHPDDLAEDEGHVARLLAGEADSFSMEKRYLPPKGDAPIWVHLTVALVRDAAGAPAYFISVVEDIGARKTAEAALVESEARLRFLDELARETAGASGADEVLAITTRMVGEHLGVTSCAYADMDPDEDGFTIRGDWAAPGGTSIVGRYRLADFGRLAVQELGAGRPLIVNDNLAELAPEEAATFQSIGIGATICMPLVKDGRLTALMAIHDRAARRWTDRELSLLAEVTERSWAHIERVGTEAELRESEARLKALTNNLPVAMVYQVETSRDMTERRYTYVSDNCERMTTVPAEEALSDPLAFVNAIDGDEWPKVLAAEQEAARDLKLLDVSFAGRLRDGRRRRFHVYSRPRELADGRLIWDGLLLDVTAQHAAEAALRDSEGRLRLALDAGRLAEVTFHIRPSQEVEHSGRFAELFGHPPDRRLTLEEIRAQYHPEDLDRVLGERKAILESDRDFYDVEHRIVLPDGATRWILGRGRVERGADGQPLFVTAVYLDVSEDHQAQAALKASEERLRLVTDAMPALISYIDADQCYRFVNQAYETWFGRPREDVLGRPLIDVLGEAAHAGLKPHIEAALEGRALSFEGLVPYKDGGARHIRAEYTPDLAPDGTVRGYYALVLDVSDQKQAEADVRASEARFRELAEAMPQLVWTATPDGRVDYYNARKDRYAGLGGDAEQGFDWAPMLHPDDIERTLEAWNHAAATGEPYACEHRLALKDGGWAWHVSRAECARDASGAIVKWYGTATDIDELKTAEEAVRESEARKSVLVELNARIAQLTDPDEISFTAAEILAKALQVDRAGYGLIDPARETISIARDWNAPGVQSLAGVLNFRDYGSYIEDLKRGETVVFADAREDPRTRDTAAALEAITARSIVNMPVTEEGSFVALLYLNHGDRRDWSPEELALIREVATVTRSAVERRRVEAELREEKRALEILNEAGTVVAADVDLEAVVQRITDAGVALTGAEFGAFFYNVLDDEGGSYMLYSISGVPVEAFSRFPMPRNTEVFAPTFAGQGVVRSDDITQDPRYGRNDPHRGMPEGHLPVRSYLAIPVRSRTGEVLGGLFFGHSEAGVFGEDAERGLSGLAGQAAVAIDNARLFQSAQAEIRQRMKAEADLQALNANLEARVEAEVAQRLVAEEALFQSQKMETIGQLTGGVAHDFNNLLTPIVGTLDLLRRRLDGDERALRLTDGALQAADRARTLVQRLLAFSRRQHLEPRPVDVGGLIRGMEDLVSRSLGPQIALSVEAPSGLPAALIDPNQLELAILNLAVNARDAMPDGGSLSIRLGQDTAAPSQPDGRYLRVEVADTGVGMDPATLARAVEPFFTTKGVGRGTGLGLSSVHGMAVQSGGAFRLESAPGQGTTAILWLPAAEGEAEAAADGEAASPRAAAGSATVLLVDDEDLVRLGTAEMLSEAGYRVVQAASADQALQMVRSGLGFDALITDYAMPGMTGADLAREVRALRPETPVLMITGYASLTDVQTEGLPRLAKPFRQTDLAAAVAEVLEG